MGICSRGRGDAIPPSFIDFRGHLVEIHHLNQSFRGFLGATGQTGLLDSEQTRPVRPVQCTGQTGPGRSVLQFFRFASDLLRDFARSFEGFCVGLAFQ